MKMTSMAAATFTVIFLFSCATSVDHANRLECVISHWDEEQVRISDLDGDQGRIDMEALIATIVIDSLLLDGDGDFEKLEHLTNQLENRSCKLADGRSPGNFVYSGFDTAFKFIDDKDLVLSNLKKMQDKHPNAVYPILAEAMFWVQYAWQARGSGFASTVPSGGFALFRERLAVAEQILVLNKSTASVSPIWYQLMFYPMLHLEHTEEEINKYYSEGFNRHKGFLSLYIAKRNQLRPRWGGSWQEVDEFINWSAENTKEIEGMGMYARLYFGVYDNLRRNEGLFRDTFADWDKLKIGLRDLVRIYPNSAFHKNIFALMACEARDEDAYIEIRTKIDTPTEWGWSPIYSASWCDKAFSYSQSDT